MEDKFWQSTIGNILINNIPQIKEHFHKQSIDIRESSRFPLYFKCITELCTCKSKDNFQKLFRKYPPDLVYTAIMETSELYGIIVAFKDEEDKRYKLKLLEVVKGDAIPDNNSNNTQERNIAFELNMAAHFKKMNCVVELTEPDIKVLINSIPIFVACKRPNSVANLEKNIKNAKRQIVSHGPGIIALSLNKIINPTYSILVINNKESMVTEVTRIMKDFIIKNHYNIMRWAENRKVFGIMYSFSCIIQIENDFSIITGHKVILSEFCSEYSSFNDILNYIRDNYTPISC